MQGMCSVNGSGFDDNAIDNGNSGNNDDNINSGYNICSFRWGGCWRILCIYKTTLLTEIRGAALASSCLISRLVWISGPRHVILVERAMVSTSPKAEPEARTLVQIVYVEGDPGNRNERIGGE